MRTLLRWGQSVRRPIVAGNWKMHGATEMALRFCEALKTLSLGGDAEVVLFPPAPYLGLFTTSVAATGVAVGAQDIHPLPQGPCTGDISAPMVADLGGAWALVGHSERRQGHGEDDALVARKFAAALAAGLRPVLCVGETLRQREAGRAEAVVRGQLEAVVDALGVEALGQGALAYEPVWAIGTGVTASPQQAEAMHAVLREAVASASPTVAQRLRLLYGGSVKAENAAHLFSQPNVDGGLVGGASLNAGEFLAIVAAAGEGQRPVDGN